MFSPEPMKVSFNQPELIITDNGAQVMTDNRFLKYPITAAAMKTFFDLNRRYFQENSKGDLLIDDNDDPNKTFQFEESMGFDEGIEDGVQVLDFDDQFTTDKGGITYGLILNPKEKWVSLVFRGTVGIGDIMTDRDFRMNEEFFFRDEYGPSRLGGKPGTHAGFTRYLETPRKSDFVERPLIDRIMSSVDDVFAKNPQVKGKKDFRLFITGHSLGGALANMVAFHAANLKERGDKSVANWPSTVKAMTFAAPVIGNDDFNKEYQVLEKSGVLRHIRISNQGDVVPTNNIPLPMSLAIKGDSSDFTQNGVNFFLRPRKKMDTDYRNTKPCAPQLAYGNKDVLKNHGLDTYQARLDLRVNAASLDKTIEELYAEAAGDFTN